MELVPLPSHQAGVQSEADRFRNTVLSRDYPTNIFNDRLPGHALESLAKQLDARADDLFCDDNSTKVRVLELTTAAEGYLESTLSPFEALEGHLLAALTQNLRDPERRFVFINAPHSRAALKISRGGFLMLLTYYQVLPLFLRYVLPFGGQHEARDFHTMGFGSASCFDSPNKHIRLQTLGRSGLHIDICYSLKSVERSERDQHWPWAIRQCSVHHRFDLETQQMSWIIVKANRVIQDDIKRQCDTEASHDANSLPTTPFNATLSVHRILAAWAGENWHWYINDLESKVQKQTRPALYIPLDSTIPGPPPRFSDRSVSGISRRIRSFLRRSDSEPARMVGSLSAGARVPQATTHNTHEPVDLAVDGFTFKTLQDVQELEDKANEARMILKANCDVLSDIQSEYRALQDMPGCLQRFAGNRADVTSFDGDLSKVGKGLRMEQHRADTLLKLLAERKSLIQGILQYRNMEASQRSASKMENLTEEMHVIAQKTKVETVSMRIITLVTLFYLPGTFISTLMSTPVVKFDTVNAGFGTENIGVGALQLYLALSLPLVGATFFAWFVTSGWEKRRARQEMNKDTGSSDA